MALPNAISQISQSDSTWSTTVRSDLDAGGAANEEAGTLGRHLFACRQANGWRLRAGRVLDTMNGFLRPRMITAFVLATIAAGAVIFVFSRRH
ncbi:MAG: hypothetical protein ABI330_06015 [Caldimonas sp.]